MDGERIDELVEEGKSEEVEHEIGAIIRVKASCHSIDSLLLDNAELKDK
jgi:hypothetical protein